MFAYPKQAEFNRVVPKSKIYVHARPTKRVRELFVTEVGEILWKYKLSPETINLPARNGITEIQVFEIALKTPELDDAVWQTIDRAIPFPLLFQLIHGDTIRFAASYKRPSEADSSKWVIEGSFQTEPQLLSTPRPPLPVALDLAGLYEQIIRCHLPLPARPGESLADQVARHEAILLKQEEKQKLKAQLAKEIQFNRKVELNAALRSIGKEISELQLP